MIKLFILSVFVCCTFAAVAQTGGQAAKVNGGYVNTDTSTINRHLAICDTMSNIFRVILDSFKDANQLNASANKSLATNARYAEANTTKPTKLPNTANTLNEMPASTGGGSSKSPANTGNTGSNTGGSSNQTSFRDSSRRPKSTSNLPYYRSAKGVPANHTTAANTQYKDSANVTARDTAGDSNRPSNQGFSSVSSYSDSTLSKPFATNDNNNIVTGSPFVYYCPYQSGNDSAYMLSVFNDLVSDVKSCLLRGAVKNVEVMFGHDPVNPRILRYGYYITALKPGADPKMKNISVQVEFHPDTSGIYSDHFTLYRVNLIIHP
jgi:hypothetical protein